MFTGICESAKIICGQNVLVCICGCGHRRPAVVSGPRGEYSGAITVRVTLVTEFLQY